MINDKKKLDSASVKRKYLSEIRIWGREISLCGPFFFLNIRYLRSDFFLLKGAKPFQPLFKIIAHNTWMLNCHIYKMHVILCYEIKCYHHIDLKIFMNKIQDQVLWSGYFDEKKCNLVVVNETVSARGKTSVLRDCSRTTRPPFCQQLTVGNDATKGLY